MGYGVLLTFSLIDRQVSGFRFSGFGDVALNLNSAYSRVSLLLGLPDIHRLGGHFRCVGGGTVQSLNSAH